MAQARELGQPLVPSGEARSLELGDLEAGASVSSSFEAGSLPHQGSFLARIFLTWAFPLLRRCASVDRLAHEDLFALEPSARPGPLFETFIRSWQEELLRRRSRRRPPREGMSVLKALFRVHFRSMWLLWIGRVVQVLLEFTYPLALNRLLKFAEDLSVPRSLGLMYALGLFVAQGVEVLVENNIDIGMRGLGLRMRGTLICAVFRKVLLLRQDALQRFSTGTLNNMITTDVDKVLKALRSLHVLILTAPLKLAISLVALHRLMGVAVWLSFAWMALVMLINPPVMWLMGKMQDRLQSRVDERVRRATEAISAIQVIKCHAWEQPTTAKVEQARSLELLSLWRLYCLYIGMEAAWNSVVPMTTCIMFASYSVLNPDDPLTAAKAFTAMNLLYMVNDPLFEIPYVLSRMMESLVAGRRLERLFVLPEARLPSTEGMPSFCDDGGDGGSARDGAGGAAQAQAPEEQADADAAIEFERASFVWPHAPQEDGEGAGDEEESDAAEGEAAGEAPAATSASRGGEGAGGEEGGAGAGAGGGNSEREALDGEFRLSDISLRVQKGALVAVVGATASGKTSLLHAVLGEMPSAPASEETPGRAMVHRHRPMAFAPQQPWIFSGTVRQNILFGEAFSEKRYAECLRCCDLEKDLELLKDGDETKVGEKGIALSGGQKARVCLARAAYRQSSSSLFLLDDPYSALDAHVARKVHEEAVRGLLAKKTRLVATNRLEFVRSADLVVVLEAGRVEAVGKYDEVRRRSSSLRTLLAAQGLEAAEEEEASGDVPPPLDLQRQFSRALSYNSAASDESPRAEQPGAGQEGAREDEAEEEGRAMGQIRRDVIFYYLRSMGGPLALSCVAFMYLFAEAVQLAIPIWLAHWTTANAEQKDLKRFLVPYVALSVATVLLMGGRDLMGNVYSFRAARRLHASMLEAVLRAPMSFFQDTPHGRIINRFSKDVSEIDGDLIWTVLYTLVPLINILGNFGMVGLTSVFSLILFAPLMWLYAKLWKYYSKAAMDIKRLSKVMSSPVYDHFANLCRENAISIVRAHRQVERQCSISEGLVSDQQRTEYAQLYMESWFSMRMDHLGCTLVLSVALCVVCGRGSLISASSAALALTFSQECSSAIQSMIGMLAEFGVAFNCVERVKEYCMELPSEAPALTDHRPPEGWPSAGALEVRDLRLRYRPQSPLVLKGLTFSVAPGERLGVCGRTGAGKSSLLLALLRIVEPEAGSEVRLDGEDLLTLGLRDVRSNIAMIPQDPVLFRESLRYNCDPFGEHSADQIWQAIEEAQLAPWLRERALASASASPSSASSSFSSTRGGRAAAGASVAPGQESAEDKESLLGLEIKEGGQNLSAGQRQMVAIARAVLRRARLVVLDEATAAVDAATDAAIQLAVRRCFAGASTLTIAHRLRTIADSDRVLVLSEGNIAELGPPDELAKRPGGLYASMTQDSEEQ